MDIPDKQIYHERREMKTNVRQTSLMSYSEIKADKAVLGKRQQLVYTHISAHPDGISDRELSKATNLPINSITGRRNELIEKGFIKQKSIKYDSETDRWVMTWTTIQ